MSFQKWRTCVFGIVKSWISQKDFVKNYVTDYYFFMIVTQDCDSQLDLTLWCIANCSKNSQKLFTQNLMFNIWKWTEWKNIEVIQIIYLYVRHKFGWFLCANNTIFSNFWCTITPEIVESVINSCDMLLHIIKRYNLYITFIILHSVPFKVAENNIWKLFWVIFDAS